MTKAEEFLNLAVSNISNKTQYKNVLNAVHHHQAAVSSAMENYANLELARRRAAAVRHRGIENLERYLIDFEYSFTRRGGKIIWAVDAEDAQKEILKIVQKEKVKWIMKAKSMVTDEIHLNGFLKEKGIETIETDLGQYIQQLSNEEAFHLVVPAMHKSKEDIISLFKSKKGLSSEQEIDEETITEFVRQELREKFITNCISISGANFLIADTGAVAVTENEGNFIASKAFAKTHIVVAGIEKIIPTLTDLDLFWPLLASHATGQQVSVYNSILFGPKQEGEKNSLNELYVVLLDNGRSDLLAQTEQRKALSCIKCGACLNVCPVWQHVGGQAYGSVYSGPIGSVINQFQNKEDDYKHLSNASTLCGKCTEVCPVNIDLHKQLLYNRRDNVEEGANAKSEGIAVFFWKTNMLKRSKMDKGGQKVKNFMLRQFFKKQWGEQREFPKLASRSFNQMWREKNG